MTVAVAAVMRASHRAARVTAAPAAALRSLSCEVRDIAFALMQMSKAVDAAVSFSE